MNSRTVYLGRVNMHAYNNLLVDRKTRFFVNAVTIVLDNAIFLWLISLWVPETFAVKFKSCLELQQILDIFCPPKF